MSKQKNGFLKIIDFFSGFVNSNVSFETWKQEVEKRIRSVFILLEKANTDSITKAKVMVNEQVVNYLRDKNIASRREARPVLSSEPSTQRSEGRADCFPPRSYRD